MFFVYHGYCSPDNCDASEGPTYKIRECKTADEVAAFKAEFDEGIHDECSNVIFRVLEGTERRMKAVEKVSEWAVE